MHISFHDFKGHMTFENDLGEEISYTLFGCGRERDYAKIYATFFCLNPLKHNLCIKGNHKRVVKLNFEFEF